MTDPGWWPVAVHERLQPFPTEAVPFEHRRDAERFLHALGERLGRFDLALHPDKTRLIEFGRNAEADRRARGLGRPETFDFLGFTHYCRKTGSGRFGLGRKPAAKRVRRTLKRIGETLRWRMHHDLHQVARWLGRVVNGWLNYYAVPTSFRFLRGFIRALKQAWLKVLRRRSQPDDRIVGVAHDDGVPLCPLGPPLPMEPEVEDIVQVNVRQSGIWEPYDSGNLSRCGR